MSRGASVHLAVWLALAVSVGGCAQLSVLTGARPETGAATAFEMLGRVYVRFGQRGFSGTLRWVHGMPSDEIWLGGPLGQTVAHILRDASGATLTTADQQTYRSFSLEGLTEKGLGWTLPVADLSFYVLGQAPPQAVAGAERDAEGRLTQAQHEGWVMRWIAPPAGESRPGRLEMRKGDVEIRLVIDHLERQP